MRNKTKFDFNNKKLWKHVTSYIILSLLPLMSACDQYDDPASIWSPSTPLTDAPVITGIIPPDSAMAGVREITIQGNNFASNATDTNWVYVDGNPVIIKSATENMITFYRPAVFGDAINISVVVPSVASLSAHVSNYIIEEPVIEYGIFSNEAYQLTDIEVDNEEYLYIATRRKILKLATDGIAITEVGSYGSAFAEITDIKFGPDGYLYTLVGDNELFRIDVTTGNEEEYVSIPENTDVLDFDSNGNIYAGRRDGIFVINPDKTITATGHYNDVSIVEVRVYNSYLYVATASVLYRNEILDNNGTLGEDQSVIVLEEHPGFSSTDLSSFNFDINGTIYLCLKSHPQYSIFVLEEDGTIAPYYKADILPKRVDQIIWGSNRYIYLNRGSLPRDSIRVYRMGMDKIGAPYLGRNN